jgi:serine/threonine protein kinase
MLGSRMFRTASRESTSGSDNDERKSKWSSKLRRSNSKGASQPAVPSPLRIGEVEDLWPIYSNQASDYVLEEPIGHGASSVVHKALYKPLDQHVAVKILSVDKLSNSGIERLRREAQLMSLAKFENVLRVHGEWMQGNQLFIATRLMKAGSMSVFPVLR